MRYLGYNMYGYVGDKMHGVTVNVGPEHSRFFYRTDCDATKAKNLHNDFQHTLHIQERMRQENHRKEAQRFALESKFHYVLDKSTGLCVREYKIPWEEARDQELLQIAGAKKAVEAAKATTRSQDDPADKPTPTKKADRQEDPAEKPTPKKAKPNTQP